MRFDYGATQQPAGDFILGLGKYKGKSLRDVPLPYLRWLKEQTFVSESTRKALERWLRIPTNRE
jgi:uncharacterized protein (DUF3820 family)